MGQVARQNKAARFIAAFDDDYGRRSDFQVGQQLTVASVHLACREGGEEVVLCVRLADETGREWELDDGYVRFDPEYGDPEELIARLIDDLHLTDEEVRQRLREADLLI